MAVSKVSIRAVRVKLQRLTELVLRRAPVPVIPEYCEAEDRVSFGQGVVNRDCLLQRRFRLREKFIRWHVAVEWQRAVRVCESDIGERVIGVEIDRLLEICDGGFYCRRRSLEGVVAPADVKLVGFGVQRV